MKDIPEDVMRITDETWRAMGFVNDRLDQRKYIALAIMADRERLAAKSPYEDYVATAIEDEFPSAKSGE